MAKGVRMLSFSSTAPAPLQIQITLPSPRVYLDHSVLAILARNTDQPCRFREVLERTNGTLMLSWAHVIELFALGNGPTFERVRCYLRSFGGRFALIDADPNAVIEREQSWVPDRQNPGLDEGFIRLIGDRWDGRTEMSMDILLSMIAIEDGFFEAIKVAHQSQKVNLKNSFDQQRERYENDKVFRKFLDSAIYPYAAPNFMTSKVQLELMRESVRTNETFNFSDGLDFLHAVASISYCTHVVFDKKWARRCRKVQLPKKAAAIFDGTQMHDLLEALSSAPPLVAS